VPYGNDDFLHSGDKVTAPGRRDGLLSRGGQRTTSRQWITTSLTLSELQRSLIDLPLMGPIADVVAAGADPPGSLPAETQ